MRDNLIIGVTHHLLCPEVWDDPAAHERTLGEVVLPLPLAAVDLFGPPGLEPERVRREARLLQDSGKRVVYTTPFLHLEPGANPSGLTLAERDRALALALRHLDCARAFGASLLTVVSGPDPGEARRQAAQDGFADFLDRLSREAGDLPVAIEPMDRTIDKMAVVGPTAEAAAVIARARAKGGTHLGLICDMAHVPLLGEGFDEAVAASGDGLLHVHLGNCLLDNKRDELYGDKHPPLEYPGGVHDRHDLTRMIKVLAESGYLDRQPATLSFEIRPAAGLGPAKTVDQHLAWLAESLEAVCDT